MNRSGLFITAAVLSGILYGLNEISVLWKSVLTLITVGMLYVSVKKSRGKSRKPLLFLFFLSFLGLTAGFFRARSMQSEYEQADVKEYLSRYEATNPGEFSYASYLRAMDVKNETERKKLKERDRAAETPAEKIMNDLSDQASAIIDSLYDTDDAGILRAMLLGDKTSMESGIKNLYQDAGISHLLAVSGLHISMVGMGTYKLLGKLGLRSLLPRGILAAAATSAYTLFTGAQASAVRAAVMLILGLSAAIPGRKSDGFSNLSVAAVLLLLYRPFLITYSGFQLSFAAMAGVYGAQAVIRKIPENQRGYSSVISCMLISVFTLPIIASCYYKAPFYAVLLNIIVIPLMSFVFISGSVSVLLAYIGYAFFEGTVSVLFAAAAGISSVPARYLLLFYRKMSELSLKLPFARIITGKPAVARIVIYYSVMAAVLYIIASLPDRCSKRIPLFVLICYFVSFPLLITREKEDCYVRVLDVGQGDCFHIRSGNRNIVIDCGSSGSERAGSRILEPYLLSKGIGKIDVMILTHADSDHSNGLMYLLSENSCIETGTVVFPAMAEKDERYDEIKAAAGKRKTAYAFQDGCYSLPDGMLQCIYSETDGQSRTETNSQSSVWFLRLKDFTMLFTGDISEEEEKKILKQKKQYCTDNDIDVLKIAHHGSQTASCREFLEEYSFSYAVLSYGRNNRYKHPAAETVAEIERSGSKILATAEQGSICFRVFSKGFEIETWK